MRSQQSDARIQSEEQIRMLAVSYRERKCGVHRPTLRYERYNVVSDPEILQREKDQ